MKYVFGLLGLVLAAVMLASALQNLNGPSGVDYARESYEIARLAEAQERAAELAPLRTAVEAAASLLPIVAAYVLLFLLAALGVAAITRFRARIAYAEPNQDGLLPVLLSDSGTARAALDGYHQARIEAGRRPNVPVHYAPHITYSPALDYRANPTGAAVLPTEQPAALALPGLTDLAALSYQPSLGAILLGLGEGGELITVPAKALCHVAMVGATGGGKSNLMRLVLPQLQAIGARVVLADPHYAPFDQESGDDWRPIASRLHLAPAVSAGEISALFDHLVDELDRRLELRRRGERIGPPLFLAMDELPVIADSVPGAVDRLARLLREGRKVGLLSVGAAQSFLVKVIGGDSSAREAYRTAFYVGGDLRSAAALLDLPQREIAEGALGQGVAYLRSASTAPARLVRIPLASNQAVAGLLQATSATDDAPAGMPDVSHREATTNQASRSSVSPEAARVADLFRNGVDLAGIVADLRGVRSNQGRKYQQAAGEIQQLLRDALT